MMYLCSAFNARITHGHMYNDGDTVTFDTVLFDNGNGFNSTSGVYTAPQTGVYGFSWTIRIYSGG